MNGTYYDLIIKDLKALGDSDQLPKFLNSFFTLNYDTEDLDVLLSVLGSGSSASIKRKGVTGREYGVDTESNYLGINLAVKKFMDKGTLEFFLKGIKSDDAIKSTAINSDVDIMSNNLEGAMGIMFTYAFDNQEINAGTILSANNSDLESDSDFDGNFEDSRLYLSQDKMKFSEDMLLAKGAFFFDYLIKLGGFDVSVGSRAEGSAVNTVSNRAQILYNFSDSMNVSFGASDLEDLKDNSSAFKTHNFKTEDDLTEWGADEAKQYALTFNFKPHKAVIAKILAYHKTNAFVRPEGTFEKSSRGVEVSVNYDSENTDVVGTMLLSKSEIDVPSQTLEFPYRMDISKGVYLDPGHRKFSAKINLNQKLLSNPDISLILSGKYFSGTPDTDWTIAKDGTLVGEYNKDKLPDSYDVDIGVNFDFSWGSTGIQVPSVEEWVFDVAGDPITSFPEIVTENGKQYVSKSYNTMPKIPFVYIKFHFGANK